MPSVLEIRDTLHMWYGGFSAAGESGIGHAFSTDDGLTWTRNPENPVLNTGPEGSWDEDHVYFPLVIYDETNSIFHLWYVGGDASGNEEGGYASSTDGINWTKYASNPIPVRVGTGAILLKDNKFHLWGSYATGNTGYFRSDDGITWSEVEDPVMRPESGKWDYPRAQSSSVVFDGNTYHLWYSGGDFMTWQIGYATSTDGIAWTKHESNPVVGIGETGSWDGKYVGFPSVMYDSDRELFRMWYWGGKEDYMGSIGYAETYEPAWQQMKPLVTPKLMIGSCAIDQDIYIFGGFSPLSALSDAEKYNTQTGETTVLQKMNAGLGFPSVDTMNNKIYVAGGFIDAYMTYNQLQEYDPGTGCWILKQELPINIGHHVSGVIDGKLYVAGGLHKSSSGAVKASGSYVYDPATDVWDPIAPMNSTISQDDLNSGILQASSCVLDGKLYVFGGFRFLDEGIAQHTATSEMYDPEKDVWTDLDEMPLPVAHHASVVYNDKIYLFGGTTESNYGYGTLKPSNRVFEYDPSTDSWQEMEPMPFAMSLWEGHRIDNYLYLVGGDDDEILGGEEVGTVWRFNLDSLKACISATGISLDRDSLELVVGDARMIVVAVTPANACAPSRTWTSGNNFIATIADGTVTGVAAGETYIYVTTSDGKLKDSCFVTVTAGTGIEQSHYSHIAGCIIYPNPANKMINIVLKGEAKYTIEITSVNGQLILNRELEGGANQVDISSFKKGVYFITIRSKDFITTRKIIKM
jgi:N-acetylneuraminic acid mutarotase